MLKAIFSLILSVVLAGSSVAFGAVYDVYSDTPTTKMSTMAPVEKVTAKILEQPAKITAAPAQVAAPAAGATTKPWSCGENLAIEAIGVCAPVYAVGLNASGEIGVPNYGVGRWNGGTAPGENGVVFLDGHVFGVFSRLAELPVGATITLNLNGTHTYRVAKNATYALDYLNDTANGVWAGILRTPVGGARGLNIMTCAGAPRGNTYDHRTVVYAYEI